MSPMFFSYCCCGEREEVPNAQAPSTPAAAAPSKCPAPYCPPAAIVALGYAAESGTILQKTKSSLKEVQAATHPSSSLLEASVRRLATAAQAQEAAAAAADAAAHAGLCQRFVEAYMHAVKEGNVRWASEPQLAAMLAEGVELRQEGRTTAGLAAVTKRLERGVETLVKLGGQGGEAPTYTLSGPRPGSQPGRQVMECDLRRGSHRMLLVLEFGLKGGKIAEMDFRRGKAA